MIRRKPSLPRNKTKASVLPLLSLWALLLLSFLLCSCTAGQGGRNNGTTLPLSPYADVRGLWKTVTLNAEDYSPEDIITYCFNQNTLFKGNEKLAAAILEQGRNPGLDVSRLHAQGITGKGVTVAIIDQPLLPDHPEYAGKIVQYHTIGLTEKDDSSSMHGPAVTSLLTGNTIGTAPDVSLYYVAIKFWDKSAPKMGAEALDWLIAQNETLPESEKIRAVSLSGDFTNTDSFEGQNAWEEAVQRAQAAGILVLDCRKEYDTCVFWPSFFDPENRDDITTSKIGTPDGHFPECPPQALGTPVGYRTTAEIYEEGSCSFFYDAIGGHSWAIPYGTGILALGWQINPALTGEEMLALMQDTAYINTAGERFLDPSAFVEAVQATLLPSIPPASDTAP